MQGQSQKQQLKQQAKSLLLKGCYKMASNKYQRLIDLGGEGFSQREWAIINLNKAICLQFLQQHKQALEWVESSIKVDPKYQKAYYRRIQILRELGRYQQALQIVPSWLQNKQIDELQKQIRVEYYNSLGIDQIIKDIQQQKQYKSEIKKELFTKFYERLFEKLEQGEKSGMMVVGQKMAKCYSLLKTNKSNQDLQSFLSVIYLLLIKIKDQPAKRQFLAEILAPFWNLYFQLSEPLSAKSIIKADLKSKQQYKLLKFAPNSELSLPFLRLLVTSSEIVDSEDVFDYTLQLIHLMTQKQRLQNKGYLIRQILDVLVTQISKNMSHELLGWLNHSFLLIDSLIKLHLHFEPNLKLPKVDLVSLFYLRFYYLNRAKDSKNEESTIKDIKTEEICEWLLNQLGNFTAIYVVQQFVYILDKKSLSSLIPAIEQQLQVLRQLKQMAKQSNKNEKNIIKMSKQYQLVYISIMLKIDLKHSISRVKISSLLSYKHNRAQVADQAMADIAINTILLLIVSSTQNLLEILSHPHTITQIVHSFTKQKEQNKIQHIAITINLVYLIVVDLSHLQEVNYAKKMGVSVQEIEKAKQMQGQAQKPELKRELAQRREKFKDYIAKHWIQTLVDLSTLLLKIKQESLFIKWGGILASIAAVDASRLHNSIIIQAMLEAFKYEKSQVGIFFSILCKRINSELLKYEQFQSIANVLIYNTQNADHELVIFESLLGLINLTSNTNHQLKIPIKPLQNCLLEENRYIVHGSLELLNNTLIYFDKEEIAKLKNLTKIIEKYIAFYREEVVSSEENVPLTDYSHPARIYSTLLSLAIVIDLEHIQEFRDWPKAEQALMKIEGSKAITLFKVALYMNSKQKLKGKWWTRFENDIKQLEKIDKGRWMKLKQYMK